MNIDFSNVIMNSGQVETFAYNIFRDVGEYLKNHIFEYFEWNIQNKRIVITLDNGVIEKKVSYNYKLCQYYSNPK